MAHCQEAVKFSVNMEPGNDSVLQRKPKQACQPDLSNVRRSRHAIAIRCGWIGCCGRGAGDGTCDSTCVAQVLEIGLPAALGISSCDTQPCEITNCRAHDSFFENEHQSCRWWFGESHQRRFFCCCESQQSHFSAAWMISFHAEALAIVFCKCPNTGCIGVQAHWGPDWKPRTNWSQPPTEFFIPTGMRSQPR